MAAKQPWHSKTVREQHARAFRDAVRDILADDGVFSLADEGEPHTLYHFDGVSWSREDLPAKRVQELHDDPRPILPS
jgi:hypothetical protein